MTTPYQYLESRPKSNYRQLWVKGHRIRAEVLYRPTVNVENLSPQQVADEYGLPLAAVLEAIQYCQTNLDVLEADRSRGAERWREYQERWSVVAEASME